MARDTTPRLRTLARHSQLERYVGRNQSVIARRCERAVVTAYRELRAIGNGDLESFQACTTLYRIHHPESSMNEARRLVSEWVDHHVIRGDTGPTPGCECAED